MGLFLTYFSRLSQEERKALFDYQFSIQLYEPRFQLHSTVAGPHSYQNDVKIKVCLNVQIRLSSERTSSKLILFWYCGCPNWSEDEWQSECVQLHGLLHMLYSIWHCFERSFSTEGTLSTSCLMPVFIKKRWKVHIERKAMTSHFLVYACDICVLASVAKVCFHSEARQPSFPAR